MSSDRAEGKKFEAVCAAAALLVEANRQFIAEVNALPIESLHGEALGSSPGEIPASPLFLPVSAPLIAPTGTLARSALSRPGCLDTAIKEGVRTFVVFLAVLFLQGIVPAPPAPAPPAPAPPAPVPFTPPVPAKNPSVEAAAPVGSGMWTVTVVLPDDPSPKQAQEFGRDNPAIIAPLTDLGSRALRSARRISCLHPGRKRSLKRPGLPPPRSSSGRQRSEVPAREPGGRRRQDCHRCPIQCERGRPWRTSSVPSITPARIGRSGW